MTEDDFVLGFKMYAKYVHELGDQTVERSFLNKWAHSISPFLDEEVHKLISEYRENTEAGIQAARNAWRVDNSPLAKALL